LHHHHHVITPIITPPVSSNQSASNDSNCKINDGQANRHNIEFTGNHNYRSNSLRYQTGSNNSSYSGVSEATISSNNQSNIAPISGSITTSNNNSQSLIPSSSSSTTSSSSSSSTQNIYSSNQGINGNDYYSRYANYQHENVWPRYVAANAENSLQFGHSINQPGYCITSGYSMKLEPTS